MTILPFTKKRITKIELPLDINSLFFPEATIASRCLQAHLSYTRRRQPLPPGPLLLLLWVHPSYIEKLLVVASSSTVKEALLNIY